MHAHNENKLDWIKHINSTVMVTNKEEEKCEQELQAPELSLLKGEV